MMNHLAPLGVAIMMMWVVCPEHSAGQNSTSAPTGNGTTSVPVVCPSNETNVRNLCVSKCASAVFHCENGGTCHLVNNTTPECVCREDRDTIYSGPHCKKEGTFLALPLNVIIAVTAGGGGFLILLLLSIIVGLLLRRGRGGTGDNKDAGDSASRRGSRSDLGQHNPAFSSMKRRSDFVHHDMVLPNGGDVQFGYKDPTRQHHYARNSLHDDVGNMAVLPSNGNNMAVLPSNGGITRKPWPRERQGSDVADDRERQRVEKNPDYHSSTDRPPATSNEYSMYPRVADGEPRPGYSGKFQEIDTNTYIYRPGRRQ